MPIFSLADDSVARGSLLLTLQTASITLPLLLVFGVAVGYWLGRKKTRWLTIVDFVVSLPLVFPPIATGFLLLLIFGRQGWIGSWMRQHCGCELLFQFPALVLAAFIAGLPLVVKQVQAAVRRDSNRLIEASFLLGKSPFCTFFHVVLPNLRRSIAIGLFLGLARSLGEVGISLMLGGNIVGRTNTISLEIYNSVFTGEYGRALTLVLVLAGASLLCILLTRYYSQDH